MGTHIKGPQEFVHTGLWLPDGPITTLQAVGAWDGRCFGTRPDSRGWGVVSEDGRGGETWRPRATLVPCTEPAVGEDGVTDVTSHRHTGARSHYSTVNLRRPSLLLPPSSRSSAPHLALSRPSTISRLVPVNSRGRERGEEVVRTVVNPPSAAGFVLPVKKNLLCGESSKPFRFDPGRK